METTLSSWLESQNLTPQLTIAPGKDRYVLAMGLYSMHTSNDAKSLSRGQPKERYQLIAFYGLAFSDINLALRDWLKTLSADTTLYRMGKSVPLSPGTLPVQDLAALVGNENLVSLMRRHLSQAHTLKFLPNPQEAVSILPGGYAEAEQLYPENLPAGAERDEDDLSSIFANDPVAETERLAAVWKNKRDRWLHEAHGAGPVLGVGPLTTELDLV